MPPGAALNIRAPFALLDLFRFTRGIKEKEYDPSKAMGVESALHLIELRLITTGLLSKRKRVVHTCATDGHRLAHYWWELEQGEQFLGGPFYLDGRAIKAFLAGYPVDRQFSFDYRLMKVGPQLLLKVESEEGIEPVSLGSSAPPDVSFPDYPKIFPKEPDEGSKYKPISLDGQYLEDFVRYKRNQNSCYSVRKKLDPTIPWPGPQGYGLVIHHYEAEEPKKVTPRGPLPGGRPMPGGVPAPKVQPDESKNTYIAPMTPARITYEHELMTGNVEFLLMVRSYG